MQLLTNELRHKIQEDAAKISPADIETYYKEHLDSSSSSMSIVCLYRAPSSPTPSPKKKRRKTKN